MIEEERVDYQLHAAWGLRPNEGNPFTIIERHLPPEFRALADDEQWDRIQALLLAVGAWGQREGWKRIRIAIADTGDRAALNQAGFVPLGKWTFAAPFTRANWSEAIHVRATSCVVTKSGVTQLEELETWDSVLLWLTDAEKNALESDPDYAKSLRRPGTAERPSDA